MSFYYIQMCFSSNICQMFSRNMIIVHPFLQLRIFHKKNLICVNIIKIIPPSSQYITFAYTCRCCFLVECTKPQKVLSLKQRICRLASDERMMDAKYRNRKFKLSSLMRCFLVINHLWSHSGKPCKSIYNVFS